MPEAGIRWTANIGSVARSLALLALTLALVTGACASSPSLQSPSDAAPTDGTRRVILIIGDGTGLAQWSAAVLADDAPLAVSRLPEIGLVDTRCVCSKTTDSGASGTAYGIGMRTGYRMIGMGPDSVPRTSVLEAAEARGMATGIVTTTHITDATPAAFGAHVASRYNRFAIAAQYAAKDIEVLLGGGKAFFARRPDGRDLIGELRDRYTVVTTPADFAEIDIASTDRLLGLFADSTIFPDASLRPSMPDMARAALTILDRDPDGFFLLLESEDTDDLGHDNVPIDSLAGGMRALDSMIAVALEYQAQHPGTLVVVTGDHETGGLSLQVEPEGGVSGEYATGGHSASMIPIFAGGPGAEAFGAWLRNEEVGQLLLHAVGAPQP